jgi:hypothetical protein
MSFYISDKNNFIEAFVHNKKSNKPHGNNLKFFLQNIPYTKNGTSLDNVVSANNRLDKLVECPFSVDKNSNIETTVQFNQNDIISCPELPEKLIEINLKFNGLCELICNKILIDDLLGRGNKDFLKKEITTDALNKESILKSHLLDVYSVFNRMLAFLFCIYPDNIFSIKNQWNLVKQCNVNEGILLKGLGTVESGTTLKLEVFKRTKTSFSGHSLLVKKINADEFIFFDPNTGEHRGLSKKKLVQKINDQLTQWGGTDIFFSKGDSYKKRLQEKKIIKVFKSTIE